MSGKSAARVTDPITIGSPDALFGDLSSTDAQGMTAWLRHDAAHTLTN